MGAIFKQSTKIVVNTLKFYGYTFTTIEQKKRKIARFFRLDRNKK